MLINLSETYELSVRALANYRASNDVNVFVVTVNVIEKVIDRPTQTPLIASPLINTCLLKWVDLERDLSRVFTLYCDRVLAILAFST